MPNFGHDLLKRTMDALFDMRGEKAQHKFEETEQKFEELSNVLKLYAEQSGGTHSLGVDESSRDREPARMLFPLSYFLKERTADYSDPAVKEEIDKDLAMASVIWQYKNLEVLTSASNRNHMLLRLLTASICVLVLMVNASADSGSATATDLKQFPVPVRDRSNKLSDYAFHPILKTHPGENFNARILDSDLYTQLAELPGDDYYFQQRQAEQDAAEMIADWAIDRSLSQIRSVFRFNMYYEDLPLTGSDRYLAYVGFCRIPVTFFFKDGKCISTRDSSPDESSTGTTPAGDCMHPVLKVKPFEPLGDSPIEKQAFKELSQHLPCDSSEGTFYKGPVRCFKNAEIEAAVRFCQQAKGLNELGIIELVGKPLVNTGNATCWTDSQDGERNWIYCWGVNFLPIRLVMDRGVCAGAEVLPFWKSGEFTAWKATQLCNAVPGKTVSEILKLGDEPSYFSASDGKMSFSCGGATSVFLEFDDDRCTKADCFVMMGLRPRFHLMDQPG